METKEIIKNSPSELITAAISSGADLDKLEKLLTLQERWEANEAKKAYHRAMTDFKKNPPMIDKDRKVSFGNTHYSHSSLANVTAKINDELSKYGLSACWNIQQNGTVSVTCVITHEQGHSEKTTVTAPADNSGSKNAIQSIGSTITYLERYSLLALTGLATQEMDDDGIGKPVEYISEETVSAIMDDLVSSGSSIPKFCTFMKVEKLSEIRVSDMPKVKVAIESKRKKA